MREKFAKRWRGRWWRGAIWCCWCGSRHSRIWSTCIRWWSWCRWQWCLWSTRCCRYRGSTKHRYRYRICWRCRGCRQQRHQATYKLLQVFIAQTARSRRSLMERQERRLAAQVQHLSFRQLLYLLAEILLEIQYRCDTGDNLYLSSSPSSDPEIWTDSDDSEL